MDGRLLAEALAHRLQEVVPPDYVVVARGGLVWTGRRDGSGGGAATTVEAIVDQSGDLVRRLVSACDSTLDLTQDIVVQDSRELWPGTVPTSPRVAVRAGQIVLWYGGETGPVLYLPPIDIY